VSSLDLDAVAVEREGRTVLSGVSIAFPAGSLTAVIGPNGAGKSTLLAVAAGLLAPREGEVRLQGRPLRSLVRRELARRRAYLPQNAKADWPLSVERVVALGLTPSLPAFGGVPEALQTQVEDALRAHDLTLLRDRPVTALSGGELSRAMLARAVVGDPEILIVDEPTAGLDPRHAIDCIRRLRQRADQGRTVIMAIHDLDLAIRFADRAAAVKNGALLAAGPAAEIFTEALLSRIYDVTARIRQDEAGAAVRFIG